MAKEAKKEAVQAEATPAVAAPVVAVKAAKPVQSKDNPPKDVAAGKKAVWHETFSYPNSKGTVVTVLGHWEIINAPKPKTQNPVAPAAADAPKA